MYPFKDLSSANSTLLMLRGFTPFEGIYLNFIRSSLDITNSSLILVILVGPLIMSCIIWLFSKSSTAFKT